MVCGQSLLQLNFSQPSPLPKGAGFFLEINMKNIFLILGLLLFSTVAQAQTSRNPCYINATGGCTPVSTANPLPVTGGGGGGGLSVTDQAAWTEGTSPFTPTGGVFNDAATLSAGQEGTVRLTTDRQMKVLDSAVLAAVNSPIPAQSGIGNVNIGAVTNAGSTYETIAASQTGQILGTAGAIGDYLSHCVIYPTTTTPGVVTVFDDASAAGTNVIAFPGGASSVSNLAPISIPVGAVSVTGEWRVTTGANLVVTCYGKFT